MRPVLARFEDIRPAAVASCAAPRDVVDAIAQARREGLPLAVRSGGHCFAGRSDEAEGHAYLRSEFFAERLSPDTIDALVAQLAGDGFHRELDFSPWGGAYTRPPVEATAFAHRDARFLLKHGAVAAPGAPPAAGVYPNFPEDGLDEWAPEYHPANREQLLALKRRYDPEGVFA